MTAPLPPGTRITAYAYVYAHGLMSKYGTMEWLGLIGYRAASEAGWRGIEEQKVWEGGSDTWFWVHTWPEALWAAVIARLEREEKTAFADAATAQDGSDYPAEGSTDGY